MFLRAALNQPQVVIASVELPSAKIMLYLRSLASTTAYKTAPLYSSLLNHNLKCY